MNSRTSIRVAAAVIARGDEYLLSRRPAGTHLAGFWEFPGGKLEQGESPADALERELREELGIDVAAPRELTVLTHEYPERTVELTFLETSIVRGTPHALQVAEIGWFRPDEMPDLPILPADLPLVALLASRRRPEPPRREGETHA
ncbi:MAG: (deoxy)nucleoside triphosphate pyrophosphohydrolase [Acidobacteriota bacterium]|nr:(deoxy)nucleoside triphosphate pyrophosphohydrolase [Acidobacteriota bacterium]